MSLTVFFIFTFASPNKLLSYCSKLNKKPKISDWNMALMEMIMLYDPFGSKHDFMVNIQHWTKLRICT